MFTDAARAVAVHALVVLRVAGGDVRLALELAHAERPDPADLFAVEQRTHTIDLLETLGAFDEAVDPR